jgi:hypothetical protein
MRIALYFTGMIRTFKKCYKNILEALDEHDIDVFLSIWNTPGTSLKHKKKTVNVFPELNYKNINKEFIKKEFPDINFVIIDIEDFSVSKKIMDKYTLEMKSGSKDGREMASDYYKIKRCNELRKKYQNEHNISYDFYMRCRPDCTFYNFPNLIDITEKKLIINKFATDLYYSNIHPSEFLSFYNKEMRTLTCLWLTNDSQIMETLCNHYDYIKDVWNIKKIGERMFGKYIKYTHLDKYLMLFDFKVEILRSHGNSQKIGILREW